MAERTQYIGVITNKAGKFIKSSPKKNHDWGVVRWMRRQEEWDYRLTTRNPADRSQFHNDNFDFRVVPLHEY